MLNGTKGSGLSYFGKEKNLQEKPSRLAVLQCRVTRRKEVHGSDYLNRQGLRLVQNGSSSIILYSELAQYLKCFGCSSVSLSKATAAVASCKYILAVLEDCHLPRNNVLSIDP